MKVTETPIPGLRVVHLDVHGDKRGFFVERYNAVRFREHGITATFVQDNHSRSAPGVLRGLHYQYDGPQSKLVGAAVGRIFDVAVDLRPGSTTFGKHFGLELNDENGLLLWIPWGFAHGFCVLGESPADLLYKVDHVYNAKTEGGIHWADPELAIQWPIQNPVVSARDRDLPKVAEYRKAPPSWPNTGPNTGTKSGQE